MILGTGTRATGAHRHGRLRWPAPGPWRSPCGGRNRSPCCGQRQRSPHAAPAAGMPTRTMTEVQKAAESLVHSGVNKVLVKLGSKGSLLVGRWGRGPMAFGSPARAALHGVTKRLPRNLRTLFDPWNCPVSALCPSSQPQPTPASPTHLCRHLWQCAQATGAPGASHSGHHGRWRLLHSSICRGHALWQIGRGSHAVCKYAVSGPGSRPPRRLLSGLGSEPSCGPVFAPASRTAGPRSQHAACPFLAGNTPIRIDRPPTLGGPAPPPPPPTLGGPTPSPLAAAAAGVCITRKGAMPSLPSLQEVEQQLSAVKATAKPAAASPKTASFW